MKQYFKSAWTIYNWIFILMNIILLLVGLYFSHEIMQEVEKHFDIKKLQGVLLIYFLVFFFWTIFYWFAAAIIIACINYLSKISGGGNVKRV